MMINYLTKHISRYNDLEQYTKAKIRKRLFIFSAVISLLPTAAVSDNMIDHNLDGECFFTQVFQNVYLGDDNLSVGVKHQLSEIEENYEKRGVNIEARYIENILVHGHHEFSELSKKGIKDLKRYGFDVVRGNGTYYVGFSKEIAHAYTIKFLDPKISTKTKTKAADIIKTQFGSLINTGDEYLFIENTDTPRLSLEVEGDTWGRGLHR